MRVSLKKTRRFLKSHARNALQIAYSESKHTRIEEINIAHKHHNKLTYTNFTKIKNIYLNIAFTSFQYFHRNQHFGCAKSIKKSLGLRSNQNRETVSEHVILQKARHEKI